MLRMGTRDWTDVRLNTFGLLTLLAIYVVLGRNSQPDGGIGDTFAAFGLCSFALVPSPTSPHGSGIRHQAVVPPG